MEWRTNLELETDENGYASFRGFYGDYEIEAEGVKIKFAFSKNG